MERDTDNPKTLLILSPNYWHGKLKFRRHQFAELAAEDGYRVIFINPTFTILSWLAEPECRPCFFSCFKFKGERINEHLTVHTMPPLFPFQARARWVKLLNAKIAGWFIRRLCRRRRGQSEVWQIVYLPEDFYRLVDDRAALLYECVDEYSEYPWNLRWKQSIEVLEAKLMQTADLVSFTSQYLLEKKRAGTRQSCFAPNGVNFELFNSALSDETPVAEDIRDLPDPIVLYVGAIMDWFDLNLLRKLATAHADWQFVLVGPLKLGHTDVIELPNIHYLGVKQQTDLPGLLKRSSVGIIPFIVNDLIKGVNPLKLYEYLAAGKPVVSTELPDVIPFEQEMVVHIGRDHAQFLEHLEYLIDHRTDDSLIAQRVDVARQRSWPVIYRQLFDALEKI